MESRTTKPPFDPDVLSEEDTSLFDKRFTKMTPVDSPCDHIMSSSLNAIFEGFTYVHPSALVSPSSRNRSPQKQCGASTKSQFTFPKMLPGEAAKSAASQFVGIPAELLDGDAGRKEEEDAETRRKKKNPSGSHYEPETEALCVALTQWT